MNEALSIACFARRLHFSSAYAYAAPGASPVANEAIYGRWAAPDGLGCNFTVECVFVGSIDPLTGMTVNLTDVDCWMRGVVREFDHHSLAGHFRLAGSPATADAIARAFHDAVKNAVVDHQTTQAADRAFVRLIKTRLREGSDSWTEWSEAADDV
jgi:6-pyruvoyl-tetrahydropterin synthase